MLPITYRETVPDKKEHFGLLRAAHPDWTAERRERIRKAFDSSQFVATAWAEKELVGTVRVISDDVGFALIADLLVHPDWRRQGIGGTLVKMCQHRFSGCYLYADPAEDNETELKEFYIKLGFKERGVFRKI